MTATLPDIMAAVLKEANCFLPLSLTTTVNRNGAVTLTANPYTLVTGAPYREVNSKVATAPKLKVEEKDKSKIHEESKRLNLILLSC